MSRMGKTEEDWNGLKLGFLKTVQPNSFSKLIPAGFNFKNNAQETYLFVSDLWFCHLHVISLLTLRGRGRVIGKIQQNELDCSDTARTQPPQGSFKQADSFYQGHVHTNVDVYETAYIFTRVGLSSTRSQWISSRKPYLLVTVLLSGVRPAATRTRGK